MKLSLIVAVYNEERHLSTVIDMLMRSSAPKNPKNGQSIEREWIFVNDASTDGSLAVLELHSKKYGFKVLNQEKNSGKGAAIIRGIKEATGDFILIQDADFEYDPEDIPKLCEPLMTGAADVVYGSRFKKSAHQVHRTYHYFVNRFLTFLSNLFSGIYLTDMETCYKVFRADLIKSMNLKCRRFGIEVELTAYIAKIRPRIFELPINYFPRTKLQGKKINWKDGVAALWFIFKFNKITTFEEAFTSLPEKYTNPISAYENKLV